MKSSLVQQLSFGEDARKAFESILSVKESTRQTIIDWFKDQKSRPVLNGSLFKELAIQTDESADDIRIILYVTRVILETLGEFDDRVDDFIFDLEERELLGKAGDYKKLKEFFSPLEGEKTRYYKFMQKERTAQKVMPDLRKVSSSSVLKPIIKKEFEYADGIENYSPEMIGVVITGQIGLTASDTDEQFLFQVDSYTLNRFIADLLALQKEMKQLEEIAQLLPETIK